MGTLPRGGDFGNFSKKRCQELFSDSLLNSYPVRKIFYNMTVTSLSVVVALFIGIVELAQVLTPELGLKTGVWRRLQTWDFGS